MTLDDGRPAGRASWRATLATFVDHPKVQHGVAALIVANALLFGLETSPTIVAALEPALTVLDTAILAVFVVEIALRLIGHGWRFFRDPWSVFDLCVVGIALAPSMESLSALRALRVLRVLRLITVLPQLRAVVAGLLHAVPGLSSIAGLLCILLYVGAVIATNLYGATAPEYFGTLGGSLLTLFQIMTLEGWADILREVMKEHPSAWVFFVPFVLGTTFTVLNLFIAVIVEGMQATRDAAVRQAQAAQQTASELHAELARLQASVDALRRALTRDHPPG
jgi:voltage-gated sodium channel